MLRFVRMLAPLMAALVCVQLLSATVSKTRPPRPDRPRNVILMIPDGFGPAGLTLARICGGRDLELDKMLVGLVRTHSSNSLVSDSGASATAMAAGIKTFNGAVGVDPDGKPVATLIEAAEARGMATGLVATSRLTHATPAAFSAHVTNLGQATAIADQQIKQNIDVLLGGGARHFLPKSVGGARDDERNLFTEARQAGYQVLRTREEFDGNLTTPLLGVFADGHLDFEIDRDSGAQPSLAEMTRRAIELLKQNKNGFLLVVSGSRIEHAGYAHDVAAYLYESLAFDNAVAAALEFARTNKETLVVCASGHDTGGMSLGRVVDGNSSSWHPGNLKRVKCSIRAMGAEMHAGADPIEVIAKRTGIGNVSESEQAQIKDAAEAEDQQRFVRLVSEIISSQVGIGWSSWGNTGVDVALFAAGPGAGAFYGVHDNTDIALILAEALKFDLAASTAALRKVQ